MISLAKVSQNPTPAKNKPALLKKKASQKPEIILDKVTRYVSTHVILLYRGKSSKNEIGISFYVDVGRSDVIL